MKEVVLGIDIGGTNTKFGFVDSNGKIIIRKKFSTDRRPDIKYYIKDISKAVTAAKDEVGNDVEIKGIGIGAPNGNFYRGTMEMATNLPWKGMVPLAELISDAIGSETLVTNDANAAALGEMIFGAAKNMKDFVVITVGTGLGSGIVANGEVIYGYTGFAGELGHTTVNVNGRMCGCGRKGCLETYVSATGIRRTVYKLLADSLEQSILRGISFNDLSTNVITESALKGDKLAIEAFEYTGRILGLKLSETVLHLSPEAIFITGGLARAKEFLFEPVRRHLNNNLMELFKGTVKVLPSGLNDQDSSILGAASLVHNKFSLPK